MRQETHNAQAAHIQTKRWTIFFAAQTLDKWKNEAHYYYLFEKRDLQKDGLELF
jgi:hypothetical protein